MAVPTIPVSFGEIITSTLKLQKFFKSMRNAPKELAERALQVENYSAKISLQTQFLQSVAHVMETEHRQQSFIMLEVAKEKLEDASKELVEFQGLVELGKRARGANTNTFRTKDMRSRARYAMKKESIDASLSELQKWHSSADISWRFTMRIPNGTIDRKIKEQSVVPTTSQLEISALRALLQNQQTTNTVLSLSRSGLTEGASIASLPFCVATLLTKKKQQFIVDTVVSAPSSTLTPSTVTTDVQNLAQKLREYKGSFGLLQCKGTVENNSSGQQGGRATIDLIFEMPLGLDNPRSLRSALLGSEKPPSLSFMIRLGLELAKSVAHIHILDFVHKSIRPETILLFREPSKNSLTPFLVGFEKFRKDGGHSTRIGSDDWKINMYAHPMRYGPNPEDNYVMQHDIYSLGVCLLEIGLWEPFISYEKPGDQPTLSGRLTQPRRNAIGQFYPSFKQQFLTLARESLPARMGTRYARVVETCLTCLDEGNNDFGDEWEFKDENGILVGVRYIEKVITQLDAIQV